MTLKLTDLEILLLNAVVEHGNHKGIARELGYSEGTIRVYLHHLYQKIGTPNMTLTAVWWVRETEVKAAREKAKR